MFALLCMGVCGVRGLEGGDVGTSVCCMGLKLMPYVVFTKEKKYTKKNISVNATCNTL